MSKFKNCIKDAKESIKDATISTTSVVLGTAYVGLKLAAEATKKLEASIITSIDDNYCKSEIYRARMESYNAFRSKLNSIDNDFKNKVNELNNKFKKNLVRDEITLTDRESMNYAD